MNLYQARLLKLKIVQALKAADQVPSHPLYVKIDKVRQAEDLAKTVLVSKYHLAREAYPTFLMASDIDVSERDVVTTNSLSEVEKYFQDANRETFCIATVEPFSVEAEVVNSLRDIVDQFWRKIRRFSDANQHLTWSIGIAKEITGEFYVTVRVLTSKTLGKALPLPQLGKLLIDAYGMGDTSSVVVSNPVTPALTANTWPRWSQGRHDTARPGIQIGVQGHGTSTLTAKFKQINNSENHVFLGSGHGVFATKERNPVVAINQPGDGASFGVARRDMSSYPQRFGQTVVADFSYIEVSRGFTGENRFDDGQRRKSIVGLRSATVGDEVFTLGAVTGFIERQITSIEEDVEIIVGDGLVVVLLDHMISLGDQGSEVRSGDSGGPVLMNTSTPRNYELVGMVVAGRGRNNSSSRPIPTVITPIDAIVAVSGLALSVDT